MSSRSKALAALPVLSVAVVLAACGGGGSAQASQPDSAGIRVVDVPTPSGDHVRCAIFKGMTGASISCDWSVAS